MNHHLLSAKPASRREFLKRADMVKFARYVPDADHVEAALTAADRFLDETKLDAPLIEERVVDAPEAAHARVA